MEFMIVLLIFGLGLLVVTAAFVAGGIQVLRGISHVVKNLFGLNK